VTVLFALLVLALIAVVIVVFLKPPGRSVTGVPPEAAEAQPNTADLLPSPFGVNDLQAVQLPLAIRGYRMADVDALLERIGREWQPRGDLGPPTPPAPPQAFPAAAPPQDLSRPQQLPWPQGQPVVASESPPTPPPSERPTEQ
jgi:DivIVA domain-containing protein